MRISISGTSCEVPEGITIQELLRSRDIPGDHLIVELNGEIIKAERWGSARLKPADSLEIVQLVVGG